MANFENKSFVGKFSDFPKGDSFTGWLGIATDQSNAVYTNVDGVTWKVFGNVTSTTNQDGTPYLQSNGKRYNDKIKAAIEGAYFKNSVDNIPLCQAPTWQPSTFYSFTSIVRGATGTDTDSLYYCVGVKGNFTGVVSGGVLTISSATGLLPDVTNYSTVYYNGGQFNVTGVISAGSTYNVNTTTVSSQPMQIGSTSSSPLYGNTSGNTSPSGTGSAFIQDGPLVWLYMGKARDGVSNYPLYSTVTPASTNDVMNGYIAFPTQNNVQNNLGLTNVFTQSSIPNSPNLFDIAGAWESNGVYRESRTELSPTVTYYGVNSATNFVGTNNTRARVTARFSTNAKKWMSFNSLPGYGLNQGVIFDIKVNNQKLSESPIYVTAANGSNSILLNVGKFGKGKKVIEIDFNEPNYAVTYSVSVQADEAIWADSKPNKLKGAIEGDSLTQGGYFGQNTPGELIEQRIFRSLGIDYWYNNALGGTAITYPGSSSTWLQRLPDLVANNPDIVLVNGVHNDVGSYYDAVGNFNAAKAANVISQWIAYFTALRTALPNADIFVIGCSILNGDNINTGGTFSLYDLEVACRNAYLSIGDAKGTFIPVLTAPQKIIPSNNTAWFFQNGTLQPYSDGHPIPRFYDAFIPYIVDRIRKYYQVS